MQTLRELIDRNAHYYPAREALVFGDRRLTHAQYAAAAKRLAGGLYRLGLRRQERFAVLAMNGLEIFLAYAAAEVSGFICAPVNYRLAAPEVGYQLQDSGSRVLVFEAQYAELVAGLRATQPQIMHYVCIGRAPDWATGFEELLAGGSEDGTPIEPSSEDYAYLWYTSGTTGKPKGVAWRQRNLLGCARMTAQNSEMNGATRLLQVTPAFHIGGKGYPLGTNWDGGCTVVHRSFDPIGMLETIQRERITHTFMVAAMVQAVLAVPDVGRYDLSSIRNVFSAAAPIPVPVLRRAIEMLGPVFSIQYGCTEVSSICSLPRGEVNPLGDATDLRRLGSVGHAVADVDLRLLDEHGDPCPPGKPGEVVMRSAIMLDGYWNNTTASIEALRDGWYYTGDIGVQDEQGYLYLVDRKKDMIISGGENIYCREVEEALANHPAVADCAVIGVPDPIWVEAVKAVVVLKSGSQLNDVELIAHCKVRIASYKCPKSVSFAGELPRLASGKLDKPMLRAQYR